LVFHIFRARFFIYLSAFVGLNICLRYYLAFCGADLV
jgi:hypothetical protein